MSVRSMLVRTARLERARTTPVSPFDLAYGSLEAFEADVQVGMDTGALDSRDMPLVVNAIRRWHQDGVWG